MLINAVQVPCKMRGYGHGKPPEVLWIMAAAFSIRLIATLGPIASAPSRAYDAVGRDPVQRVSPGKSRFSSHPPRYKRALPALPSKLDWCC